ncbi:glycosyltransferase family 25 protein [Desulforhopalus sp. 52FAK]
MQSSQIDSWAFFDRIYCISLESRPDRKEQAIQQFEAVGLLSRVEFIIVEKHPVNQEKGIFLSHMTCLEMGLKDNANRILVFEDDVFFDCFDTNVLDNGCRSLDSGGDWDAFFLGCISDGSRKDEKTNLAQIAYRCLAHAYALNAPFAKVIVEQPWDGTPFDELIRRQSKSSYALYPMCAFQGRASSDNQTVIIDRMRRMLGGLPFIQKANEFYQNRKTILRVVTIGIVMALVTLLTLSL